ncbi:MAG TPA: VWA domain-containing protein [Vicinamibacterales bacterium]|nr:VWA domain-containing protein [Vicinamibacterales bacterium]
MRTRLVFVVCLAAVATLTAQDRGQPTFRAGANYVRVDMYAMRDGQPVNNLEAADIEVLEDGVPQKVEDFEHVVVRSATTPATRVEVDGLRGSREAAGDPRSRVFVIFLDTYHTQLEGSAMMRKPLSAFLDRVLGPDDLVALMTPEMAGSDIALGRKTDVIEKIVSQEWWGRRARIAGQDPKEILYEECLPPEQSTNPIVRGNPLLQEVINRRREKLTLDALDDLMTHLAGLRDERKAVVLVTEGWVLYQPNPRLADQVSNRMGVVTPRAFEPPVKPPSERGPFTESRRRECEADVHTLAAMNSDVQFRRITEDANRGNVTFYPVYARGLASFDAPIGPDYPPPIQQDMATLRTRHNNLRTLAVDTDGEAIIDTNYIEKGLKRIADDLSSYYLFGYYSTNAKLDGRYRTITVRVKQPDVRVRARRGYRARTAEQVVAAAAAVSAVDPAAAAVSRALNSVVAVNPPSTFRVRPAVWTQSQGGVTGGMLWVVGELDFRMLREPGWSAGGRAEVLLLDAAGEQFGSTTIDVPAGEAGFSVRVPTNGPLAAGDYAVRIRLRGGDGMVSETARVIVPAQSSALGEAVMWRRGQSTGPKYVKTADPRFQRSDRMRLEFATNANGATARLLDRAGKTLQVPVQVTERTDTDGIRWIVADVTLAPLAASDYAIEVNAGGGSQVTGFRIIP